MEYMMRYSPHIVLPWLVFASLDCRGRIWGEGLIEHIPKPSREMDKKMKEDWSCYWPWRWGWSDMQILYLYIRYKLDENKVAKLLKTTKYNIRNRIKRLNLTKERLSEITL